MTTDTTPKTPAQVAAEWWADHLFVDGHIHQRITRQDGEDTASERVESQVNFLGMLSSLNKKAPPPEARDKFVAALVELIEKAGDRARLGVDYNPCPMLSKAEAACGHSFGMSGWPFKTTMLVKPESVEVKHGYGQPYVAIYP